MLKMLAEMFLPWWCDRESMKWLLGKPRSFRTFMCRLRGHCDWHGKPYPVPWHNPGGFEPDQHCENCGDNLG